MAQFRAVSGAYLGKHSIGILAKVRVEHARAVRFQVLFNIASCLKLLHSWLVEQVNRFPHAVCDGCDLIHEVPHFLLARLFMAHRLPKI